MRKGAEGVSPGRKKKLAPPRCGFFRTAVQENGGHVGVYASVIRGGRVRRGDGLELL
jgi:hypothetical protein